MGKPAGSGGTTPPKGFTRISQAKPVQPVVDFEATDPSHIRAGMRVEHQRFGTGTVVSLEGRTPDIKATIDFGVQGNKQLLLKFAKLRVVE